MEASWGTDLQRAMLLSLPLPALFRMKCVCREWNRLISEPSFASDYIARSPPRLAGYFIRLKQLGFVPASEEFGHPDPLRAFDGRTDHDAFPSFTTSTVVASSGGLLLCTCKDHCYVLCEPLTRRWRALPMPPSIHLPTSSWVVGFIHRIDLPARRDSPPRRSYRVVRLFYHSDTAMAVETFSSDSGEWETSVVAFHLPFSTLDRWTGDNAAVAVGGALHWFDDDLNLVTYDVDEGSPGLAEPPPRTAAQGQVHSLGDAGGRLGYCCKDATGFDVWVLVDQDRDGGGGRRWEHRQRVESSSTIRGEDVRANCWDCYDINVAVFGGPYRAAFKCDPQGRRGTSTHGGVLIPSIWFRRRRTVPYTWPSWFF